MTRWWTVTICKCHWAKSSLLSLQAQLQSVPFSLKISETSPRLSLINPPSSSFSFFQLLCNVSYRKNNQGLVEYMRPLVSWKGEFSQPRKRSPFLCTTLPDSLNLITSHLGGFHRNFGAVYLLDNMNLYSKFCVCFLCCSPSYKWRYLEGEFFIWEG